MPILTNKETSMIEQRLAALNVHVHNIATARNDIKTLIRVDQTVSLSDVVYRIALARDRVQSSAEGIKSLCICCLPKNDSIRLFISGG